MKSVILKKASFICKSMLWSALLYIALMLVINWEEVTHPTANNAGALTEAAAPTDFTSPANPAIADKDHNKLTGIIGNTIVFLRTIAGFSVVAP